MSEHRIADDEPADNNLEDLDAEVVEDLDVDEDTQDVHGGHLSADCAGR